MVWSTVLVRTFGPRVLRVTWIRALSIGMAMVGLTTPFTGTVAVFGTCIDRPDMVLWDTNTQATAIRSTGVLTILIPHRPYRRLMKSHQVRMYRTTVQPLREVLLLVLLRELIPADTRPWPTRIVLVHHTTYLVAVHHACDGVQLATVVLAWYFDSTDDDFGVVVTVVREVTAFTSASRVATETLAHLIGALKEEGTDHVKAP